MTPGNLQRIERLNYLLGGVMVIASALTQPRSMALGIAVGVALTCLNFFLLLDRGWLRVFICGRCTFN